MLKKLANVKKIFWLSGNPRYKSRSGIIHNSGAIPGVFLRIIKKKSE